MEKKHCGSWIPLGKNNNIKKNKVWPEGGARGSMLLEIEQKRFIVCHLLTSEGFNILLPGFFRLYSLC